MKKGKKAIIIVLCVFLAIILVLVSAFFILTYLGKLQFHKDDAHISNDAVKVENEDTITYGGKEYFLNKNIISVLVMGIDRANVNQNLGAGNNGQADVLFVATIDTKTKRTCIIPISRETMTDINIYTNDGKYAGSKKEQLCLAYAYGNTVEECSNNVITSVKRLFYGININSYVTIEMNGVAKLTDLVGGVQLTCIEDMKVSNVIEFYNGQKLNLDGKTACTYIQHRGDDSDANNRRMLRQKQFLSALINKAGNAVINDFTNLAKYYNELSPFFSTNVSFAQITYLAQNCLNLNFGDSLEYKSIEGTVAQGEKWVEFTPNEESILEAVIDVFYLPK